MRILKLLVVVLLTILFNPGIAQIIKFGNLNYSHVPIVNGDVMINWGAPTPMKINITFTRPSIEPWVSKPIKGELVLFYDTNGNRYDLLSTTFTTSDWDAGSFVSHVINRDVTFPANVLNGFNGYLNVYAKYRYYRDKYPDPENTDGWTDWIAIPGYQRFALAPYTIPVTSFEGPTQICNEGIYSITNPYTISLENASGIATLIDMGLNQWKVTRVGTASGKVTLRSTSSGKTFEKDIVIGSPTPTISGTSQINTVGEYNYIVSRNTPGSTIEYNLMLGGDVELIPVSDTEFKIKVVNPNTSGSNMIVKVRARETNSCGTSSYTIKNITLNGNM